MNHLEKLATLAGVSLTDSTAVSNQATNNVHSHNGDSRSRLLVEKWLTDRGIGFTPKANSPGVFKLMTCPCCGESDGSAIIRQDPDGKMNFKCHHNRCNNNHWQECKNAIGNPSPEHYDPPLKPSLSQENKTAAQEIIYREVEAGTKVKAGDRDNIGTVMEDLGASCLIHFVSPSGNEAKKELPKTELQLLDGTPLAGSDANEPPLTFAGIDASELEQYADLEPDWLVKDIFAADQPTIFGAASKATKTTQLVDLSVALATENPWLGSLTVPKRRKVLFITGESNYRATSKRISRALLARGLSWIDVKDWLRVEAIEFPQLPSQKDRETIKTDVAEHQIEVVIIDPLYRGLRGVDTFKMAEMGDAIVRFTKCCAPASVIISHHVIKTAARELAAPTLEDLSGAGLAESCGNWWLIGRNKRYQFDRRHDLSVEYGGRDEQSGIKGIVFDEAKWTFEITSGQEMKEQRNREKEEKKEQDRQTRLNEDRASVKHALMNEKEPRPKDWIERRSGVSAQRTRNAIADLLNDGTLIEAAYQDSLNRRKLGMKLKEDAR